MSVIYLFIVNCIEKTKIKKKRPRIAHLKKLVNVKIVLSIRLGFCATYGRGKLVSTIGLKDKTKGNKNLTQQNEIATKLVEAIDI